MTRRLNSVLVGLLAWGVLAVPLRAAMISVDLPYGQYGHLYNTDTGLAGGVPQNWCAPTATANSFQFLENQYPAIYGNKLTGGNLVAMRNSLVNGWISPGGQQRNGMGVNGATDQAWWEAKTYWIEDHAPGTTVFTGMYEGNPAAWHDGNLLLHGSPTWDFLWREIFHGEDVEIKLDTGTSLAHAVTLASLEFNDTNGNLQWDPGESRAINYVDPNNPSQIFWGTVSNALVGTRLEFLWNNGGANPAQLVTIELAYSESIPEPVSLLLLSGGLLLLCRRRA